MSSFVLYIVCWFIFAFYEHCSIRSDGVVRHCDVCTLIEVETRFNRSPAAWCWGQGRCIVHACVPTSVSLHSTRLWKTKYMEAKSTLGFTYVTYRSSTQQREQCCHLVKAENCVSGGLLLPRVTWTTSRLLVRHMTRTDGFIQVANIWIETSI